MGTIEEKDVNVYIVDDDPVILKVLENKFRSISEYNIFLFSKGEEFLYQFINKLFPENQLSVIILDYSLSSNMSVKNGLDILKEIKKKFKDTPVIMLQSYLTKSLTDILLTEGANICLRKNENYFEKIQIVIDNLIKEQTERIEKKRYKNIFLILFVSLILVFVFSLSYFVYFS